MKTVTRRGFVGVCLLGSLGASACLSPTLPPLPPPNEPDMQYLAPGQLQLTGYVAAERSALVLAINNRNGDVAGRVVRDGHYRFVVEAEPGDEIELWYEVGAEISTSLFLTAPNYPAPDAGDAGVPVNGSDAQSRDGGVSDSLSGRDAGADVSDSGAEP